MNTKTIAVEYRLAHWAKIISERHESGLSIRAFCEKSGFHENIYFYWQRKLREAACEKFALQQSESAPSTTVAVPGGWTVCTIEDTTQIKSSGLKNIIHIEIGKCRVAVTAETNHELLAAVCRTLSAVETEPCMTPC